MKIVKKELVADKIEIEIGKPLELEFELEKDFDEVSLSLGYIVKGENFDDRNVVFYESFFSETKISINCIVDGNAPPSYKGKLVSVKWFILIEAENDAQVIDIKAYPANYFKVGDNIN